MSMGTTGISQEDANQLVIEVSTKRLHDCLSATSPEFLADAQVVEALLDSPDRRRAHDLLGTAGSLWDLSRLDPLELKSMGLSWQEASRFLVALELSKRVCLPPSRKALASAFDVAAEVRLRNEGLSSVRFGMFGVNQTLEVILDRALTPRDDCSTYPRATDVFREAIRVGAHGVLVWHTHPDGVSLPSEDDLRWTDEIRMLGDVLHIPLVDHIVVGDFGFFSCRAGLGWE